MFDVGAGQDPRLRFSQVHAGLDPPYKITPVRGEGYFEFACPVID